MNSAMIEAIVRDYLRDNLNISVDMVRDGDYYRPSQVPRVRVYLGDELITEAQG